VALIPIKRGGKGGLPGENKTFRDQKPITSCLPRMAQQGVGNGGRGNCGDERGGGRGKLPLMRLRGKDPDREKAKMESSWFVNGGSLQHFVGNGGGAGSKDPGGGGAGARHWREKEAGLKPPLEKLVSTYSNGKPTDPGRGIRMSPH